MYEEQNKSAGEGTDQLRRMLCEALSLIEKKGLLPQTNQETRNWWSEFKHSSYAETESARRQKVYRDRMADWEARKPRIEDIP